MQQTKEQLLAEYRQTSSSILEIEDQLGTLKERRTALRHMIALVQELEKQQPQEAEDKVS